MLQAHDRMQGVPDSVCGRKGVQSCLWRQLCWTHQRIWTTLPNKELVSSYHADRKAKLGKWTTPPKFKFLEIPYTNRSQIHYPIFEQKFLKLNEAIYHFDKKKDAFKYRELRKRYFHLYDLYPPKEKEIKYTSRRFGPPEKKAPPHPKSDPTIKTKMFDILKKDMDL